MSDLGPAVEAVVRRCLGVRAGEDVLVVADPGTRSIGEALRDAARAAGADAVLTVMDERATDGTEPPATRRRRAGRVRRVHRRRPSRSLSPHGRAQARDRGRRARARRCRA